MTMRTLFRKLKPALAAIILVGGLGGAPVRPAEAQTDLAALLERLAVADRAESARIDRELQLEWSKSGSPAMDLLLRRGQDALDLGDTQSAIEHFTALTDHAPEFAEGWHRRAMAYFQAELWGPALADLERALALNPDNYNAVLGLGVILENLGDVPRAYRAYDHVRQIYPHHPDLGDTLERIEKDALGRGI